MKNLFTVAASFTLLFSLGDVVADDAQPLQSVNALYAPMSDAELGDVKGNFADLCFICALGNDATVTQLNLSSVSALVSQGNQSGISQSNN